MIEPPSPEEQEPGLARRILYGVALVLGKLALVLGKLALGMLIPILFVIILAFIAQQTITH